MRRCSTLTPNRFTPSGSSDQFEVRWLNWRARNFGKNSTPVDLYLGIGTSDQDKNHAAYKAKKFDEFDYLILDGRVFAFPTAEAHHIGDRRETYSGFVDFRWLNYPDWKGPHGYISVRLAKSRPTTLQANIEQDDGGGSNSDTSSQGDDTASQPLTASFENAPSTHDGSTAFTFDLRFSEELELSYRALENHAITVTGGSVTSASRLDKPSNMRWRITVEPDSNAAVTVVLPPTTDCADQGAICTEGDKPLSVGLAFQVPGPAEGAEADQNEPATGAPTIGGTPQVGKTLTASISDIADADGLDNASFEYQWMRGTTDIQGAADSSYTLVSADEGETIKVRVSFTDDDGHAESLTSAVTEAVAPAPDSLTASFSDVPASHTGAEFTFGLSFSEDLELSYKTLRDEAFAVTGGAVRKAKRQQQGSNQAWTITVEPDSASAKVTVTLPETTDCDATGAICTGDGWPLSHSLSATVNAASANPPSASERAAEGGDGDAADDALALVAGVTSDEAAQALFGERSLSEARLAALDLLGNGNGRYDLGDLLSWIERCRQGEAPCGSVPTDPGPVSGAALLAAAAAGRRRISKRPKRRGSGRRRARRPRYALAVLLAATMTWSCTDGAVVGPAAVEPDPGFLTVELTAPVAHRDIGVLLELEGPGIETVRAAGHELYQSSATGRHQLVVAGSLRPGPLVQFRVPDRSQLPLYRVRVIEVTGEGYGLRDAGDYRAVIKN